MAMSLSRRSAVSTGPRSRALAMPAVVRRVDVYRPSRHVPKATKTPVAQTERQEQAGNKARALGFIASGIGALAVGGAISIASGIVPISALAGLGPDYKTIYISATNRFPPALLNDRFVAANAGCNPEVTKNSQGVVTDLKFVYESACPNGAPSYCKRYPYPAGGARLYEKDITTQKLSALNNTPPVQSNIWIRCNILP